MNSNKPEPVHQDLTSVPSTGNLTQSLLITRQFWKISSLAKALRHGENRNSWRMSLLAGKGQNRWVFAILRERTK